MTTTTEPAPTTLTTTGAGVPRAIHVRPLAAGDTATVHEVVGQLSPDSAYLRFHTGMRRLPEPVAVRWAQVSAQRQQAHVAVDGATGRAVGMAQWFRTAGTDEAEVAVMVADLWQGLGIGARLVAEAIRSARAAGVVELRADVLPEHRLMRGWLARLGACQDLSDPTVLRLWIASAGEVPASAPVVA
ncbi:GNAT family N-acetyltransferase [Arsenicicoccus sp. oral taxon 190]|uniref:GNAT family N-acetyltransferase n=1 Tax=Arsenicicoccus sp. oral taxon 190 TaxID=1658671 RepID=UPI00067C00A5|nr:GNAT family N-acetyltransferase [Arsenicicoccus sp. oral taxon 190]